MVSCNKQFPLNCAATQTGMSGAKGRTLCESYKTTKYSVSHEVIVFSVSVGCLFMVGSTRVVIGQSDSSLLRQAKKKSNTDKPISM
jgi:hypothetical protein